MIDAENISASYAESLFEEIAKRGANSFCRAFGDFSAERMQVWVSEIDRLGISKFQQDAVSNYKNASDIALVIGAMDLLHNERAERFYIVTNDGDFTPLARRLKNSGMDVIGFGTDKASKSFQNACNDYVVLEPKSQPKKPNSSLRQAQDELPLAEAVEIIVKTLKELPPDGGWYSLSGLGKALIAKGFERKKYDGGATLKGLLLKTGKFDLHPTEKPTRVKKK